jgi:hypothetical protein
MAEHDNPSRFDACVTSLGERIDALTKVLEERDRRYTELRAADQAAISAALAATDAATAKAEINNAHYRAQQNEWRSSLTEVLSRSVPLEQYNTAHTALVDKINELGNVMRDSQTLAINNVNSRIDTKIETVSRVQDTLLHNLNQVTTDVATLKSAGSGVMRGSTEAQHQIDRNRTLVIGIIGVIMTALFITATLYTGFHQQKVTVVDNPTTATTATTAP